MAKPLSHISLFIGSPNDCEEERQVVREAAEHVSSSIARIQGCHIDVVGWEDMPPQAGRPQGVINQVVDECDWALFFLNKRWGSATGTHTSGFFEEFCRARERNRNTGAPYIALFFREVPAEIVADPGEQLQRNLQFRDEIFESKEFLVKTYASPDQLPDLLRGYMSQWVLTGQFVLEPTSNSNREAELEERIAELEARMIELEENHEQPEPAGVEELRSAIQLLTDAKPAQAEASLRRQLEAKPEDLMLLDALALSLHAQGRHDEALKALSYALSIEPDNAAILANRGLTLGILGFREEALESLDRSLALQPEDPITLLNRGITLGELGRHEEALESFDRSLAIEPDDPTGVVRINKGVALLKLGRYEEALGALDESLASRPGSALALEKRGTVLLGLERYEEALESLDQSLSINPNDPVALSNRGRASWRLKRYEEALESLDRSLAIRPDDAEALAIRGFVLWVLERGQEALESFDRSLAIQPNDPGVLSSRGIMRFELGSFDDARSDLTAAASLSQSAQDWLNLCCLEVVSRDPTAAGEALSSAAIAVNQDEEQAVLAWFRAALAALSGDEQTMTRVLDEVVEAGRAGVSTSRKLSDMFATLEACLKKQNAERLKDAANLLNSSGEDDE